VLPAASEENQLELKRQGLTPSSVPPAGQRVLIQVNGNVADDVTDLVHPDIAYVAALAARVVGLDIAGIDLVAEDITRPLAEQRGAIIEVNASPGLLAHIKPASGTPRMVGKDIVEHLFADGDSGRIPLVGVTGTTDAALAARLVGTVLHHAGKHVGVASRDGLFLDYRQVDAQDGTRFDAGQRLLINRTVQAAVFESNARTILTEGLPYDRCLVGIVTDMGDVGAVEDLYIRDESALFNVVRSQVDVVLSDGAAVLNADDARVVELAELSDGAVVFYALDANNAALAGHRDGGGRTVFVRDGHIVLAEGTREHRLLGLDKVKPAVAAQPGAVLAAAAAGWAMDVPADLICAGLRTFDFAGKKNRH
jgi:cyanophycin synthetase